MAVVSAIPNPVFQQAMRVITAITNAYPALVTTSFAHQYITGMKVRLKIPFGYGMAQANQQTGFITIVNTTQFTLNLDTTSFDNFVIPAPYYPLSTGELVVPQFAQVIPFAEDVSMITAATRNVLNGDQPFG